MPLNRTSSNVFFAVFACLTLSAGTLAAESLAFPNAEATKPLQPGAQVPSVCVSRVSGETVDLAAQLDASGALLVFYRGGW